MGILGKLFLPKVKDLLIKNFITLDISAPLIDAFESVMKNDIRSVIITREGEPIGILTRRDLLGQCLFQRDYTEKITVEHIMSHPLVTIDANENVLKAYELMKQNGIGRLVVLEQGKLVGIIRLDYILHFASEESGTILYRAGYFLLGVLLTIAFVIIIIAL